MSDIDQVMDKLNKIENIVAITSDRVNDLRKAVFGNGRKGLIDRMTETEQTVLKIISDHSSCPARESASNVAKRQRAANTIALGAVLISLATLLLVRLQ